MNRRILLIEDNANNRYLATFLLQAQGWHVLQATNGVDGIAMAGRELPALILLDIQLPGMDGYEVARVLKSDPRVSGIPLVAITSYAMPPDRQRALAAGCDGYLEKPIDPETFVAAVVSHLRPPPGPASSGTRAGR